LVSSGQRWALMHELSGAPEPGLDELVQQIAPCDLLLVEGFKKEAIPKLEVYRAQTGKPLLFPDDPYIVAVASDVILTQSMLRIDLNRDDQVAEFILKHVGLK
jgi:molybdopterin-guanine dinucleotide biosynthesis protein B